MVKIYAVIDVSACHSKSLEEITEIIDGFVTAGRLPGEVLSVTIDLEYEGAPPWDKVNSSSTQS